MFTRRAQRRKQLAVIHILKKQLLDSGIINEDGYRATLSRLYDVASSADLTYEQATSFIDELVKLGGAIKSNPRHRQTRRPTAPNLIYTVSQQELAKIEHLKADIHWRHPNGFNGLMLRVIKKDKIVTSKDAAKMIEAMKNMVRRQNAQFAAAAPASAQPVKQGEPF